MGFLPRRCVYCHQGEITGISKFLLRTQYSNPLPASSSHEVCYFGGSFTCFPEERRRAYMEAVFAAPERSCVRFLNNIALSLARYSRQSCFLPPFQ